jgi:hypothetical protein
MPALFFAGVVAGIIWIYLTIKDKPKIKIKLVNLKEQCFEKNLFCFDDSTANANGAKMSNIKYVISDGQLFEYTMPPTTMPNRFCFSIKDQRGGSFNLFIESTDENGCQDTTLLVGAVKVREKIGAMFTSNKPVQCDSVQAIIKNISSISQKFVKSIKKFLIEEKKIVVASGVWLPYDMFFCAAEVLR